MLKKKGVDDILNAFNIVAELEPKTHLYFIGHFNEDGKNLTENPKYRISDVIKKVNIHLQDRVHLVGYIDHSLLNEVIKAGDLYLFAYLADNFPGSLIEIALSETPIIAIDRGGISEMIRDRNGECLCLKVSPDNLESLPSTILSGLEHTQQQKKWHQL